MLRQTPSPTRKTDYKSLSQRIARTVKTGLGACLVEDLLESESEEYPTVQGIENIEPITSYSWLKEDTPTIMVPCECFITLKVVCVCAISESSALLMISTLIARPPTWRPPPIPFQCALDGTQGIQKEYRLPIESSLVGFLESVRFHNPAYPFASLDIITERNNLRKLLAWAQGSQDDFRIDIERAGQRSVLLTRWKGGYIPINNRSYGHSFEARTTSADHPNFLQHERIISYVSRFSFAGYHTMAHLAVCRISRASNFSFGSRWTPAICLRLIRVTTDPISAIERQGLNHSTPTTLLRRERPCALMVSGSSHLKVPTWCPSKT